MHEYPQLEWTPEKVKRFWDYTSSFGDDYFSKLLGKVIIEVTQSHIRGGREVLDLGCGPGFFLRHLLDAGFQTTGLDFSPESVRKVNELYGKDPKFRGASMPDEISDRKFDAIYLIEVVEHLDDKELASTLEIVKRTVADEGVFIVTTPNREDLKAKEIFCPGCCHVFHRWQHVRSWSAESLSRWVTDAGFVVERTIETNLTRSSPIKKLNWKLRQFVKRMVKPSAPKVIEPHLVVIARKTTKGT